MEFEDPKTYKGLIDKINPQIYQALKLAVELGKWESGEKLSTEQVEYCLQAIIAYESEYVDPQERIGYIEKTPGLTRDTRATTNESRAAQTNTISTDRLDND